MRPQESFPGASWAGNNGVEIARDPGALSKLKYLAAINAAGWRKIKIFQGCDLMQLSLLQPALQAPIVTTDDLQVYQQRQTFLECQFSEFGIAELFFETVAKCM